MRHAGRARAPSARVAAAVTALTTVLAALTLAVSPGTAAAQSVAPNEIIIEGRGWGHGNGLGQYGALGYAVDYGWTSAQIVDHYYGNTTAGTVDDRDITVLLTRNDRRDLLVSSRAPFSVEGYSFAAGETARLQVAGNDRFDIRRTSGCAETGSVVAAGIRGQRGRTGDAFIEAVPSSTDYTADDFSRMLEVVYCDAQHTAAESLRIAYRGVVGLLEQGASYSFNRLPLEQYLRSVVPREMPVGWGALGDGRGIAAVEAQAIAARSWTLVFAADRARRGFFTDTCDSPRCQSFGGAALNGSPQDFGIRYIHSNTAVVNTAGIVRINADGSYAFTEYSSSSGGWTAGLDDGSNFPAVQDLGDSIEANPNHVWRTTVRRVDIEAAYPSIGQLVGIEVTRRSGRGTWGGRVRGLRIVGTSGTEDVAFTRWANDTFRRTFSLRSDWYRFPQFVGGFGGGGPVVSGEPEGLWVAKADGAVLAFGGAQHYGDASAVALSSPVVAIAAHPSGRGYWLATAEGGVHSFGEAGFHGSMAGTALDRPVVAIAAHPSGQGYWLAAADGGIFSFGRAPFFGSTGGLKLNKPINGMDSTRTGRGYWLVAADGGIFAFGDAPFLGSTGDRVLPAPATELLTAAGGGGYLLLGSDGAIYPFGSAVVRGSRTGAANRRPAVAMAATQSGSGYWIVWDDGTSFPYGDAADYPSSAAGAGVVAVESVP